MGLTIAGDVTVIVNSLTMQDLLDDPTVSVILHPLTWVILLCLWFVWWWFGRKFPYIHPKYDKSKCPPGTYFADGSTKTSGTEKRVRDAIAAAGYRPLPLGTGLVVAGRDAHQNRRKLTPDIILHSPRKVIVEVDPRFWHGEEGLHKVYDDIERNKQYTALGFAVVRVRIGWEGQVYSRLGRYDVVTKENDFHPAQHSSPVAKAIRSARKVPVSYWDRQLAKLTPFHEHNKAEGKNRGQTAPQQQPLGGYMPTQMPGQYPGGWAGQYPGQPPGMMPGQYPGQFPGHYPYQGQ